MENSSTIRTSILEMENKMSDSLEESHNKFGESIDIFQALTQKPQEFDFVLPGLLTGTVGSIVSPGGAGKSMLALQIATHIAGGPDLLKFGSVKRGKVAYFAAEDPKIALQHRLFHLASHFNAKEVYEISQNLNVRSLLGKSPDLSDKDWVENIGFHAQDSRLVIIDTLRRFHKLDENKGDNMNIVLDTLDTITADSGCSVIFLHHANKGAVYSGNSDMQQASRGSSVLVDNIRWQANLSVMTKDEAKEWNVQEDARGFFVRLNMPKRNYTAPDQDKWFRRHDGGILQPAVLEKGMQMRNRGRGDG